MNKVLQNDLLSLSAKVQYFSDFDKSKILVTGSTGLIGSILVKSLLNYSRKNHSGIVVYAACRNELKFQKVFSEFYGEDLIPVYSDIVDLNIKNLEIDYIVHGASITDSKSFVEKPVETISIAIDGTRNLLNQLKNKAIKGFVYLSSLEVYGTFNSTDEIKDVLESDSGYLDTMSVRSSYSESKRLVETICKSYAAEYNFPIKVVRLCQTFGAGVEYSDNRVFAQFARSIIENKDIVLKTKGETVRNYCYTTDAVTGILVALSKGKTGEAYNIANMETTCSIAQMAQLYCDLYKESKVKVVFDIAEDATKLGYNPVVKLQLNSTKLQQLGWEPEVGFTTMIKNLVESMKMAL